MAKKIIIICIALIGIFWLGLWLEGKIKKIELPQPKTYQVKRVIDGDTIELTNGEKVRYIGMNTPEIKNRSGAVECFANEAKTRNEELVKGKEVTLEKDVSDKDKYGRWLRYVYVGNVMINRQLIIEGMAQVDTYPPDVRYQDLFLVEEKNARAKAVGLWNNDKCNYGKKN